MVCLFIFSKNQLLALLILALLIFAMVSFVSLAFISALIFMISFFYEPWGSSFLPFLVALDVELGYLFDFFLFLEVSLYCYKPSFSTAFTVSHRFWVVLFSFSFVSMHILISFLISSVICWLFRSVLFSLHMFVFLIVFFFL